eukprot:TRINITY_DN3783_c0_g1_i1.p1 TRINITY_DN3783_c0_g1~~TRINITY_DN3783_c0_g1_i1.p1  ORF type:complete len:673 (-),score=170.04 TRINITY_DN3783_c0_g1_i1:58-2076(-)
MDFLLIFADSASPQLLAAAVQHLRAAGLDATSHPLPSADKPRYFTLVLRNPSAAAERTGYVTLAPNGRKRKACEPLIEDPPRPSQPLVFSSAERIHIIDTLLAGIELETDAAPLVKGDNLMRGLRKHGLLECAMPLHDEVAASAKVKPLPGAPNLLTNVSIWRKHVGSLSSPVEDIRLYYGEQVAFYFAWMDFYVKWLTAPAVIGFLLWLFRPSGRRGTVEHNRYLPFFSLFIALWAVLFQKFWLRRANSLAFKWQTHQLQEDVGEVNLRAEFFGDRMRKNPVTGKTEPYYPTWKRNLRIAFSALVTLLSLTPPVFFMFLSLNLQGYIRDSESPVHVAFLSKYSDPGAIFDPEGNFFFVPTIIHAIIIFVMNQTYRHVATWLTHNENHRTEESFENHLIIKRVFFEFFDTFLPLFYIAFYRLDIIGLYWELVSLYSADWIRRVSTEVLIPFFLEKGRNIARKREYTRLKSDAKEKPDEATFALLIESERDEYEQFDDYLEMTIQYGYVTLFASAFPLASMLSLISNLIEIRSDSFKLAYVTRRPKATRASNIGSWQAVLLVLTFVSVLTNMMLIGFSSDQLVRWMGQHYFDNNDNMKPGMGRYVVGTIFTLEHVLYLVVFFLWVVLRSVPAHVSNGVAREKYLLAQAMLQQTLRAQSSPPSLSVSSDHPHAD